MPFCVFLLMVGCNYFVVLNNITLTILKNIILIFNIFYQKKSWKPSCISMFHPIIMIIRQYIQITQNLIFCVMLKKEHTWIGTFFHGLAIISNWKWVKLENLTSTNTSSSKPINIINWTHQKNIELCDPW